MGRFAKGNLPWNTDKKCPQMSEALLGHVVSSETRTKISNSKKGIKQPKGFGQKISDVLNNEYENGQGRGFKKGNVPHNKGKKCPKISESLKLRFQRFGNGKNGIPRSEETRRKIRKTLQGHSVTKETRQKISESHITSPRQGHRGTKRHREFVERVAKLYSGSSVVDVEKPVRVLNNHWRIIDVLVDGVTCVEVGTLDNCKIEDLLDAGFSVLHYPY